MNNHKLSYIFKNLSLAYKLDEGLWEHVSFGTEEEQSKNKVHVVIEHYDVVETPVQDIWKEQTIPFLFNDSKKHQIIEQNDSGIVIHYDVLTPIFYLLSGTQEINAPKDQYGRFQWEDSLQKKHDFTTIPVVNYYMDILVEALSLALKTEIVFCREKPEILLTHDIDEVNSAWKKRVRVAYEEKKFFRAVGLYFSQLVKPFYPWKNLEEIAQKELDLGYRPIFFFLPKREKEGAIANADYELKESYLKQVMTFLKSKKIPIGLHGSYRTHDNLNPFKEEKRSFEKMIGNSITWNRFHWLQFDAIETPGLLEEAGIKYDSTLGFQEHVGFRNGCCTPFYLYNHKDNKSTEVIEYPLTVMDCSLAYDKYMGVTTDSAKEILTQLHNQIDKFKGVQVMNYHNTFLSNYENEGWKLFYEELIQYISL